MGSDLTCADTFAVHLTPAIEEISDSSCVPTTTIGERGKKCVERGINAFLEICREGRLCVQRATTYTGDFFISRFAKVTPNYSKRFFSSGSHVSFIDAV